MKTENAASVCYIMKNAALKAGDALMDHSGQHEACRQLIDELLPGWFAGGNGDAAVWADRLAMPAIARQNKDGYTLKDFVKGVERYAGPCFAVSSAGGAEAFERGLFDVCVSIAYLDGGELQAAVVYDPIHVELFHAVDGLGVYLNGKSVKPARTSSLSDAIVSLDHSMLRGGGKRTANLLSMAGQVRVAPACGLELCYAACGRVDATVRRGEAFFDYAAGLLVAKEAGAVIMNLDGSEWTAFTEYGERRDMVVACPGVKEELLGIMETRQ